MNWIDLAQGRYQCRAVVNTVMNLPGFTKFWEVLEKLHDWRHFEKGSTP
jgi:hypothetical protein